eukprot:gene12927-14900_t
MLTPEASRSARGLLGWSLKDLAEKSGVSFTTISQFENGRPSYDSTGQKLATAFEAHDLALKSTPEHASQQVELPTDPHLAAAIFLAVLAYPLPGEGDVGSAGERYAWALNVARIRDFKKLYPEKVASTLNLPTKRQIEGQLSRGASRILRRMTARDLWAERAISGVAPLIGTPTTAADARANRVAVRKVILKNPTYW